MRFFLGWGEVTHQMPATAGAEARDSILKQEPKCFRHLLLPSTSAGGWIRSGVVGT